MDNQNNKAIKEEKEQKESEIYREFIDTILAKNDENVLLLEKLSAEAQANNKELKKALIDSETFRNILYRAFTVFIIIQFLTAISLAWFLLAVFNTI